MFIAPADGTFWTEHPYCILDGAAWVTAEQREAAEIFKKYLLDPAQQAAAITVGLRPADPAVPLSTPVVGFNVAQVGRPVALKVAAGVLVTAIVKVPATVAWNVVLATLVKTGAVPTVSVAASEVALAPMRLPATA